MTKKILDCLAAISSIATALTLGLALYQHKDKQDSEEIARWQKNIIYKIISDRDLVDFNTIKSRYITEATQLQAFNLPKKDIQDENLRIQLLELQKDKLISLTSHKLYRVVSDGPNSQMAAMIDMLKVDTDRRNIFYIQRPVILRLIEANPGLTATNLFQKAKDNKIDISEDDFYNVLFSLRIDRFVNKNVEEGLMSTYDYEPPIN
ncbi:hypothetical protein ACI2KG_28325 [Pseudomonas sp. NPDC089407]|uniref:hypothetical protein n=1 Tax=Pseudomonas sp. NPDC089407 TaxID=3364464 RepID=UPI00384D448C